MTFLHSFVPLRSFDLVPNLSKYQRCGRATIRVSREERLLTTCSEVEFQSGKAEGSVHCPRAPTPRTEQRAPTPQPSLTKTKSETALVSGFLPVLAVCAGVFSWSRVSGSISRSLRFPLFFVVSFHWPRVSRSSSRMEGTSGQTHGHRPKNRYWAPTQKLAFSGIPLRTTLLCTSSRLTCSFPSTLLFYLWRSWYCVPCILPWVRLHLRVGYASS